MCTSACERRARWWQRLTWLTLAWLPVAAIAQEWVLERYTSDNGLPQSSVSAMAMDADGYVYLLTEGGLVRFDGHLMQRIPLPGPEGSPQRLREIVDLQNDMFGIRDSHSRRFLLRKGLVVPDGAQHFDRDPYPLNQGAVVSPEAYALITDTIWRYRWWLDPHPVSLMRLSSHEWAAGSRTGVYHFRDTTTIGTVASRSLNDQYFRSGDRIFGVDSTGLLFRVDLHDHRTRPVTLVGIPLPTGTLPAGSFSSSWLTNRGTPCLIVGTELYALNASPSGDTLIADPIHLPALPVGDVSCILLDRSHDVALIGTLTQGLFVYRHTPMHTVRCAFDGPGRNNFYAQGAWDADHVLAMAGVSTRLLSIQGCDSVNAPVDTFNYQGILRDRDGRFWFGHDTLICRYDPATGERLAIRTGYGVDSRVINVWEDGDSIWVGLDHGIGYVAHDRFHPTYVIPGPSRSTDPICIRRGPDGRLWYAACNGAFRLDEHGGRPVAVPGTGKLCVRTLHRRGQRMYLGTYGSGAWVFENDSLRHLPNDRMGYLDHVHSFMPDSLGFLWMSTNRGLFRVHEREIDAYLKGRDALVYYAYYGRSAGIANTEFNGGCDPPFLRLPNGYASFPSLDGLVWFKPEQVPDPYPTAPLSIDEVLVDGVSVADTAGILLRPDGHELIVRFSLAYWGDAANAQVVYRLPGVQDDWALLPADQRELRFQHLPYGENTLSIRKLGSLGHDDDPGIVLRFTVKRPYYLAGWFLAICGAALVGLGVLVVRLYQARLRHHNLMLGRMVHARTGELQQANERLERSIAVKERLASIISHDIVTPLRFIARVAHRVPQEEPECHREQLTGTLQDIALSSDKLYMNARNLLDWIKHQGGHIELRPTHVALNPLVEDAVGVVVPLAARRDMVITNEIPFDDVLLTDRDLLGIVLQNLVNNALNHSQGSRVTITGEQGPDAYRIAVFDDGPGLPPHTVTAIHQLRVNGSPDVTGSAVLGLGYVIITELVHLLEGGLHVEPGPGARISITLPPLADAIRRPA